jgi:hypothetical protein
MGVFAILGCSIISICFARRWEPVGGTEDKVLGTEGNLLGGREKKAEASAQSAGALKPTSGDVSVGGQ